MWAALAANLSGVLRLALAGLLFVACTAPQPTLSPNATATATAVAATPHPTRSPTPSPVPPTSPSPTPVATPAPTPHVVFEDGTYLIPDQLAAGTYRTLAYTTDCYWVRFSGFDSGLADWVASRVGSGYQVVTLDADDAGFDSESCGAWTDDLAPVLESRTLFHAGTYIVGTDIEPGVYRASESENCYWARLSGLGGTDAELLEEELLSTDDLAQATIAATDVGFTSSGCGTWTLASGSV